MGFAADLRIALRTLLRARAFLGMATAVLGLVLAGSGWQLLLGLAPGMVLAPAMSALRRTVLGQPDPAWLVYLGVAGVLSAALLASLVLPLHRTPELEPSAVLRHT